MSTEKEIIEKLFLQQIKELTLRTNIRLKLRERQFSDMLSN